MEFDVFLQGTVFVDVVLTGLAGPLERGTEVMAEGMGTCPGGIARGEYVGQRLFEAA